jgi:hypothetical protein
MSFPDGSYYIGNFLKGKFHGKGVFFDKNSGLRLEGFYQNGHLVVENTERI